MKQALVFRRQRIQVKLIRMDGSERIPGLSDHCCWIFFLYNTVLSAVVGECLTRAQAPQLTDF